MEGSDMSRVLDKERQKLSDTVHSSLKGLGYSAFRKFEARVVLHDSTKCLGDMTKIHLVMRAMWGISQTGNVSCIPPVFGKFSFYLCGWREHSGSINQPKMWCCGETDCFLRFFPRRSQGFS